MHILMQLLYTQHFHTFSAVIICCSFIKEFNTVLICDFSVSKFAKTKRIEEGNRKNPANSAFGWEPFFISRVYHFGDI